MKGGYKIIDFKGINLTVGGNAVKIPGVYEALEANYRKPTLIEGFVVGNVERTARFAVFGIDGQNFVSAIAISSQVDVLTCTVTPNDMVSLVNQ